MVLSATLIPVLFLLPEAVQDQQQWADALGTYQRNAASKDPAARARAARELGRGRSPRYDKQCWSLVARLFKEEILRGGNRGQFEERVSGQVLEECLSALRKIEEPRVVSAIAKSALSAREPERFRMYLTWAMGIHGTVKDLEKLLDDRSPLVQVAAADALAEQADAVKDDPAASFARLKPLLAKLPEANRTWEFKLRVLDGLDRVNDGQAVDSLIDSLGKMREMDGRVKSRCLEVLARLVGVDLRTDNPDAWRAAWALKKQGKDPANPGEGATVVTYAEFYGLSTRSNRIVYVLDRSGSMQEPGGDFDRPAPKLPPTLSGGAKESARERGARLAATAIMEKYEKTEVKTRLQAAKKQLILSIFALDPRVFFNVVWYENNTTPWMPQLVPATWFNKLDCFKEIDKINPSGGTNIWDALETGYKMLQAGGRTDLVKLEPKANYATSLNGADTFYMLTDGAPTGGRVAKEPEFLAELRKVTRLRRVVINTICLGERVVVGNVIRPGSPNPDFVRAIAEETGGQFLQIRN